MRQSSSLSDPEARETEIYMPAMPPIEKVVETILNRTP